MVNAFDWIKKAKSNLMFATCFQEEDLIIFGGDIFFEEPCFELQQCAEKALKAVLLHHSVDFPKTHIISELIELLQNNNIEVPDTILDAAIMTQYAVRTRYPDDFRRITEEEYKEAVSIAQNVYSWAESKIISEQIGEKEV